MQTVQTHSAASDLGLHCLPRSQKRDVRLIWVNDVCSASSFSEEFAFGTMEISLSQIAFVQLTHILLMDFSIPINWTSPFSNLGVSSEFFYFDFIFIRNSSRQTVAVSDLDLHCLPRPHYKSMATLRCHSKQKSYPTGIKNSITHSPCL